MVSADEEETLKIVPPAVQTRHVFSKKHSDSSKRRKSESDDSTIVVFGIQGQVHKVPKEFVFYTKTKPSLSFCREKLQNLSVKPDTVDSCVDASVNEEDASNTPSVPPLDDPVAQKTNPEDIPPAAENGDNGVGKKGKKGSKKKKKVSESSKDRKKKHKHKSKKLKKEKSSKHKKKKEKSKHKKKEKKVKSSEHKKRKREADPFDEDPVDVKVRKISEEDRKIKKKKKKSKKHKKEKSRSRSRSAVESTRSDSKSHSKADEYEVNDLERDDLSANGHESPRWMERIISHGLRHSLSETGQENMFDEMPNPSEREVTVKASLPFVSVVTSANSDNQQRTVTSAVANERTVTLGGVTEQSKSKAEITELENLSGLPKNGFSEPLGGLCHIDSKTDDVPVSDILVNINSKTVGKVSPEKYDPFENDFDDSPVDNMKLSESDVAVVKSHDVMSPSLVLNPEKVIQPFPGCTTHNVTKMSTTVETKAVVKEPSSTISGIDRDLPLPKSIKEMSHQTDNKCSAHKDREKNSKIVHPQNIFSVADSPGQVMKNHTKGVPLTEFIVPPKPRNLTEFLSVDFSSDLDLDSFEFFGSGEVVLAKSVDQCALKVKPSEPASCLPNGLRLSERLFSEPVEKASFWNVPSGSNRASLAGAMQVPDLPVEKAYTNMSQLPPMFAVDSYKPKELVPLPEPPLEVLPIPGREGEKESGEKSPSLSSDSMSMESTDQSEEYAAIPSPTEIPLPGHDMDLPPLPPEPRVAKASISSIPTPVSSSPSLLLPLPLPPQPLPSAISIPMPASAPPRHRPTLKSTEPRSQSKASVPTPRPASIIPPPRPRHIAPLPVQGHRLPERPPVSEQSAKSDLVGEKDPVPVLDIIPVPTTGTVSDSAAAELEKEPVKIKFALKTLPSRVSRVIKYTAPEDEENRGGAEGSVAGDSDGRTSSLDQNFQSGNQFDQISAVGEEVAKQDSVAEDVGNAYARVDIAASQLEESHSVTTLVSTGAAGYDSSVEQNALIPDSELPQRDIFDRDRTPSLSPLTEPSFTRGKTSAVGKRRSRSRSPRRRSRSPRRSRSRSPRRRSPKRPRRSPPRNRKRSPSRRSVSPRRSPARSSPSRRSSPRRSSPKSSSPRRPSPRRFSPRRSPSRSSPLRRSPRRSPGRSSPSRRSPRSSPSRRSPRRASPRPSPPRRSPRRSPRRYRSPRRSPRRRSPRPFGRTSPKRSPPREFSPRRSPLDSPCVRSPLQNGQNASRRWSPKRIQTDAPPLVSPKPFSHCSPCFSPSLAPLPSSPAPYQSIPVLRQVPIVDDTSIDQTPFAIQTITSHIERQEVTPRSRKQAIHETVLIHIEPCAIPLPDDGAVAEVLPPSAPPKPENEEMEISSVSSDEMEDFSAKRVSLDERLRVELETNDEESWSNSSLGGGWNFNNSWQFSSEGSELIRKYMEELERYYSSLRDHGGYEEFPPPVTLIRVGNTLRVIPYKPVGASSQVPIKPAMSKVRINGATSTKRVMFADHVRPGEGTSPSCGEDMSSPPPPLRKRRRRKKKTPSPPDDNLDDLKAELEEPPPPPPGSPSSGGTPGEEVGESPMPQTRLLSPFAVGSREGNSTIAAFASPQLPELHLTSEQILLNLNLFGESNPN